MLVGFVVALVLTASTLVLARRFDIVSVPNERSSHEVSTANIGGLGFVVPILVLLFWMMFMRNDSFTTSLAIGAAAVAFLGLMDDLFELSAAVRLSLHLIVAAVAIFALDGLDIVIRGGLIFGLAWFVNLYNFMDGIDGIAASQAVIFCIGALFFGDIGELQPVLWLMLSSTLGFLCFNRSPARIFMGDVGSAFLGFVIGTVAIYLWVVGELPLVTSLIILSVFWFDASYTLCVRIVTCQPVTSAHRSHLYQNVARRFGHGWTTAFFWMFSMVWLAPLVSLNSRFGSHDLLFLCLACAPVLMACIVFRAGLPSKTELAVDP